MTDLKQHALDLIAGGNPDAQGAAQAYATLHLADMLDALPSRMLGQMDPPPIMSDPTLTPDAADAAVAHLMLSYPGLAGDETVEDLVADAFVLGRKSRVGSLPGEPYHFTVYEEIRQERQKQYAQGWSFEHDQEHGAKHLDDLIYEYLFGKGGTADKKSRRERLVIAAALAVAGIDLLDGKPSV